MTWICKCTATNADFSYDCHNCERVRPYFLGENSEKAKPLFTAEHMHALEEKLEALQEQNKILREALEYIVETKMNSEMRNVAKEALSKVKHE